MVSDVTKTLVKLALREDLGLDATDSAEPFAELSGDLTSSATLAASAEFKSRIISREPLVVCGHEVAAFVFQSIDPKLRYEILKPDGSSVPANETLALISGSARAILAGERTALNFMQRLSGIASKTASIVARVKGTGVAVLDTRKTIPGFRELDKYAVKTGGGTNHRFGLFDAVLIKNNHVDAMGGDILAAIRKCREISPSGTKIECEVRDLSELARALDAQPDAILLDNMTPAALAHAVAVARMHPHGRRIELEASGGITAANIVEYARSGVNSISLGELTHSVVAADLSLRYQG